MTEFGVSIVSADVLAPYSAGTSTGSMMTKFKISTSRVNPAASYQIGIQKPDISCVWMFCILS